MEEQSTGTQTMEPQADEVATEERALTVDEEIAEIEKLLGEEPDDFQARCRLGELYFNKGRMMRPCPRSRNPLKWQRAFE